MSGLGLRLMLGLGLGLGLGLPLGLRLGLGLGLPLGLPLGLQLGLWGHYGISHLVEENWHPGPFADVGLRVFDEKPRKPWIVGEHGRPWMFILVAHVIRKHSGEHLASQTRDRVGARLRARARGLADCPSEGQGQGQGHDLS